MEADFVSFTAVWGVGNRSRRDGPFFLHCPHFSVVSSTVPSIEIVDPDHDEVTFSSCPSHGVIASIYLLKQVGGAF